MEYGLFGLIILIANVYALYNIITSAGPVGGKVLWALLVLLFPLIGFIIWIVTGPRSAQA